MNLKKLLALLVAAVMLLAMSATAMAATPNNDSGSPANPGVSVSSDTTLNIPKSVVISNEDKNGSQVAGKTIYYPEMVFTFTVAGDDSCETAGSAGTVYGKTVTDSDGDKATVYKGVDGGITISSPVIIPAGSVIMNANGQEIVQGNLVVTIVPDAFPHYGIYRYLITDNTPDANITSKGIVRGAQYDASYYLDVYIQAGTTDTDGDGIPDNVVGGTVLLSDTTTEITPTQTSDKQSGIDDVKVITTTKQVPVDPNDPSAGTTTETKTTLDPSATVDEAKNDMYYTYNVTLKKTVTGNMGDRAHEFPFTISVENNIVSYTVEEPSNSGATSTKDQTIVTLKHDQEAVIVGLNSLAKINYTETNDTASVYKVSAVDKANQALITESVGSSTNNYKTVAGNGTQNAYTSTMNIINGYEKTSQGTITNVAAVTFTNDLSDVSPTGVVLRFAPYFAMMAGGTALFLVLFLKRRKNEEEEA